MIAPLQGEAAAADPNGWVIVLCGSDTGEHMDWSLYLNPVFGTGSRGQKRQQQHGLQRRLECNHVT